MYRTDGKWRSAKRVFYLIAGGLPDKLIDEDPDLSAIKGIINMNKDDVYIGHHVHTECYWRCSTIYWDLYISDCTRTENSDVIEYRIRRGKYYGTNDTSSLNDYSCDFLSYCSSTAGEKLCTFEEKNNHVTKTITYKNKKPLKSKEVIYYDFEGNIITKERAQNKVIENAKIKERVKPNNKKS